MKAEHQYRSFHKKRFIVTTVKAYIELKLARTSCTHVMAGHLYYECSMWYARQRYLAYNTTILQRVHARE